MGTGRAPGLVAERLQSRQQIVRQPGLGVENPVLAPEDAGVMYRFLRVHAVIDHVGEHMDMADGW